MEYFLQQLINGLTLGSIYGLIAIGYTMVFGIIGMINFAHGDVFMVGAFIALMVIPDRAHRRHQPRHRSCRSPSCSSSRWPSPRSGNWTIERVAYRPLRGSFRLAPLISAIGMSIVLSNFVQVTQGPRNKPMPPMVAGGFQHHARRAARLYRGD